MSTLHCSVAIKCLNEHYGKPIQQFDYSKEEDEKEFMCSATSPSGQTVVLGSFNRLSCYRKLMVW
uniref:Uncharacterized protein n=1 Tax=Amphimedon queenslandica TaxID=400682 RepID=A0A1X7UGH1_AMPQE